MKSTQLHDYQTNPSLSYLQTLQQSALSCVASFSVSTRDGSIHFPGPIDLRGFSLDDITIEPDYIQVYNPGNTPSRGTRLNRPATIRLNHSPAVQQLTKEETRKKVLAFGGQLRYVDQRVGLVEFSVQHFTRYGLDDDEGEEEAYPTSVPEEAMEAPVDEESDRFSFSPQPPPAKRVKEMWDTPPFEESLPMDVQEKPIELIEQGFIAYQNPEARVAFSPSGRMLVGGAFFLQLPQTNSAALQLLDLHLECTTREDSPSELPIIPQHTYGQVVKMWTGFIGRLYHAQEIQDSEYLVQVWSLINVLFGDPAVNISEFVSNAVYLQDTILRHEAEDFAINNNDEMTHLQRRRALHYWLKLFCHPSLNPNASTYRRILEMLSAADQSGAVKLALDTRNLSLASIISQSHRHCLMKLVEHQVRAWQDNQVDKFIHRDLQAIYEVLAGEFQSVPMMDWKQLFGLAFLYGVPHNSSIADAFRKFRGLFLSGLSQNADVRSRFSSPETDAKDVCYHLLQLLEDPKEFVTEVPRLLNPYTHSRSLEFGNSWLISQALSDVYALELFPSRLDVDDSLKLETDQTSTRRFLQELLDCGRWEWAVYVMLLSKFHWQDLSNVLTRYIDLCRGSDQMKVATVRKLEFVQTKVKVPAKVLSEAMALNAEYNREFDRAFHYYLQAEDPESAYELLIREVGPECIVKYTDPRELDKELIGTIKELEDMGRVLPTLKLSVQAYRDYCNLLLSHKTLTEPELLSLIHQVSLSIKKLPTETLLQNAARALMMETLGHLYLACKRTSVAWDFQLGHTLESSLYDGSMHSSPELLQTHELAYLDIKHFVMA